MAFSKWKSAGHTETTKEKGEQLGYSGMYSGPREERAGKATEGSQNRKMLDASVKNWYSCRHNGE